MLDARQGPKYASGKKNEISMIRQSLTLKLCPSFLC